MGIKCFLFLHGLMILHSPICSFTVVSNFIRAILIIWLHLLSEQKEYNCNKELTSLRDLIQNETILKVSVLYLRKILSLCYLFLKSIPVITKHIRHSCNKSQQTGSKPHLGLFSHNYKGLKPKAVDTCFSRQTFMMTRSKETNHLSKK